MSNILTVAREYVAKGFSVVPIPHKKKAPSISWKKYQKELPTDADLVEWFGNGKKMNIGIVTGALSGVTVVDFDTDEAITDAITKGFLTEGPIVKTSKGYHVYCKYVSGHSNFQKRDDLPGIDLRGEGGQVVAPPSVHESGHEYSLVDGHGFDQPLPDVPVWVLKTPIQKQQGFQLPEVIGKGDRNGIMFRFACSELTKTGNEEQSWIKVQEINTTLCKPPLPMNELMTLFKSAMETHEKNAQKKQENKTDLGNAERLVRYYGDLFRYVPEFSKWMIWDNTRWVTDLPGAIEHLAHSSARQMVTEAQTLPDEQRQALIKHSLKSESKGALDAMISVAKAIPGVPISQDKLDTNRDVLNVINGTLDLKTGVLHPHNREDYITRRTNVAYYPDAPCPTWLAFLDRIMDGNKDMIRYLQKCVGYTLTGRTTEQCLFIPHGSGSNGKSKFLEAIENVLGDYSTHCSSDALMVKSKGGNANNDIARLRGARMTAAIETDEGKRLSEALIKELTGGDTITARFLFSEFFDFIPSMKIWLACNHKPVIRGNDHAIWRRIKLIPFTVTIPDHEQDKNFSDKLNTEAAGILTWAVEGCLLWRKEGLKEPDEVKTATSEYRKESDLIGSWIDACCIVVKNADCQASILYDAYKEWADTNGEWVMSNRVFGQKLAERGFAGVKKMSGKHYVGIGLIYNEQNTITDEEIEWE